MASLTSAVQFQGRYQVKLSVYSMPKDPVVGEQVYRHIEQCFEPFEARIKQLPDTVEIVYDATRNHDYRNVVGITHVASINLVNRYGEAYAEQSTLVAANKKTNGQNYDQEATVPVSKDPKYFVNFIEQLVTRAEHLAKLFRAQSKPPSFYS